MGSSASKPKRAGSKSQAQKGSPKGKRMRKNKLSRAQYMRRMSGKKLSKAQKAGLWKGYAKRTRQAAAPKKKARTYGKGKGKFKALRARVGSKSRWTHLRSTKRGGVKHIPEWATLGYASYADMIKKSSTSKGAKSYVGRKERLDARRERDADRARKKILAGKGMFSPNKPRKRRTKTITFKEWEKQMRANARRRKKTTRKKRATAAQTAARRRNIKKAQAARRKKSTTKRKTTKRRVVRRKKVAKRKTAKRRVVRRKKVAKRKTAKRRVVRRKKATRKKTTRRRTARRNAPKRRRITSRKRRVTSRKRRRAPRRRYVRNAASVFMKDFGKVLKIGIVVGVGFVIQKVATKLIGSTGLIAKLPGSASFGSTMAGFFAAALGTVAAAKILPGEAKMISTGMGAGFLHTLLIDGLNVAGQPNLVNYLGNYTEAEGSAMGSYYEFSPHQTYPAMGEYYSTQGGMGQYEQAAAGMGQYSQAAAGMGQPGAPRLSQAAAGVGEYLVQGGKGIGEYEEVVPQYSAPEFIQEGISPDLNSAERALSVAEAAAGVGAYGDEQVPLQSTVYPTGSPEAIPDMPGGSRAGTFAGNNGVFGPSH